MSGHLVAIASYPKSGNTWVRLFLDSLRRRMPVAINDISVGAYGLERRKLFDALAPANAADLLPHEIEEMLPDYYAATAAEADGPVFLKVHDRLRRTRSDRWLLPPQSVKGAIYLTRHPFDVTLSYAHHLGISPTVAVAHMNDPDHIIAAANGDQPLPLMERVGSWSGNVASWIDGAPFPVTPIRYEDLIADAAGQFRRIVASAGLSPAEEDLASAVAATRFERLQDEERKRGFRERPNSSPAFFRSGKPGAWLRQLDEGSRRSLAQAHEPMMRRLGYTAERMS
jgi:aryl sulfotransferase